MSKQFIGQVVSNKMQKTIVVSVVSQHVHPVYKKIQKRNKKYKVHSEDSNVKVGDMVTFVEVKPISKDKKYKFVEVLAKKE